MLVVVADTGPIGYLIEIGYIDLLPQVFERVFIPAPVYDELVHPSAPGAVRTWVSSPPVWLTVLPENASDDPALRALDAGESAAINLGIAIGAHLILIDDRKGAAAARRKGFEIIGTLGLLVRASQRGLVDLAVAITRLKRTSFYCRRELIEDLLRKYGTDPHRNR